MKRYVALVVLAALLAAAGAYGLWTHRQIRRTSVELQSKTRTIREQRETIELLRQRRQTMLTQLKGLREQMQGREVELKEQARTDLDAALNELAKLRRLVETRNSQLDRIQGALGEMEEENEKLQQRIRNRNGTIARLRREREGLGETVDTLHGIIREKNQRILALHEKNQALNATVKRRGSTIDRLRTKLREAEAGTQSLRRDLEREKRRVRKLLDKHERVVGERNELNATLAQVTADLDASRERIRDLENMLERKAERIAGLEETVATLKEEKRRAESRVRRMQSAFESLRTDLKRQIESKEVLVERLRDKVTITLLESVLFDFGKASLTQQGRQALRKVGDVVNDLKRKKLRIVGHTDSVPIGEELRWKYPSNWELSAHRAAAVVRFLQNQCRVDPEHMEAVGRSCYHPVSSNKTPRGRARNRRVEIVIAPKYQDKDRG